MSKNNAITVQSYHDEFQTYIDKTSGEVSGSIKMFINAFLARLAENKGKSSVILEVGSGPGRDAAFMEALGYKILRTDAAENFVKYMQQAGYEAHQLDIVHDLLEQRFDAIYANAVFLHFDDDDFEKALANVKTMLKPGGILALSLHKGAFRGISDHKHSARYFQEWTEEQAQSFLTQRGFAVLESLEGKSVSGRNKEWVMLILQKEA